MTLYGLTALLQLGGLNPLVGASYTKPMPPQNCQMQLIVLSVLQIKYKSSSNSSSKCCFEGRSTFQIKFMFIIKIILTTIHRIKQFQNAWDLTLNKILFVLWTFSRKVNLTISKKQRWMWLLRITIKIQIIHIIFWLLRNPKELKWDLVKQAWCYAWGTTCISHAAMTGNVHNKNKAIIWPISIDQDGPL